MTSRPDDNDFGGFIGLWKTAGWGDGKPRAVIARLGHGEVQEGIVCDPLNLLQVKKLIEGLIEMGEEEGYITDGHRAASSQLPAKKPGEQVRGRKDIDAILEEHAVKED